jgi:glycosyltransferase involved in cell wall biosynthesis
VNSAPVTGSHEAMERRSPACARIGFVTDCDPADVTGWSGINTFMSRALAEAGAEIVPLFGYKTRRPAMALAKKAWAHLALRRFYEVRRHPAVLHDYGRQVARRVQAAGVEAVFSTGTHLTADCQTERPLFFWTDATVPALFRLYPGYERFSKAGYGEALASERRAVANATRMFFSSDWAAESAVRELGAAPERVLVVPFGANLSSEPCRSEALRRAAGRSREKAILLFAGVDWRRKGGAKAVAAARELAARGVRAELHVLGIERASVRADAVATTPGLEIVWHGRVSKATAAGSEKITMLFAQAHFLLLPTVADCTPLVFAEANAHAVPVVTHRVGGIPTMIRDDENGRMFARDAAPDELAGWIVAMWRDEARYLHMAAMARDAYEARLNWWTSARRVMAEVRGALERSRG